MKVDVLSRKNQIDIIDDSKNVKLLKGELWTRQVSMEAKVILIREN